MVKDPFFSQAVEEIRKVLSRYPAVAAADVFGSTVSGLRRKGGDVDVAVCMRGPVDPWLRIDMERELSVAVGADVDLVIFSQGSSLLQHEVLRTGVLIYEADADERIRQEVLARRRYLDEQRLPKMIRVTVEEDSG
uniref:Nucleotidyltransferase domain-containing protein n=1 Tax=Desulfacinum infernum TaxID=35837 RepID=A0A832EK84_9BACT